MRKEEKSALLQCLLQNSHWNLICSVKYAEEAPGEISMALPSQMGLSMYYWVGWLAGYLESESLLNCMQSCSISGPPYHMLTCPAAGFFRVPSGETTLTKYDTTPEP